MTSTGLPAPGTTDDLARLRRQVRAVADDVVADHAAAADADERLPWPSVNACRRAGLAGIGLPVALGGTDPRSVAAAVVIEELARRCPSTALTLAICTLGMVPVVNWGDEALARRYVPEVAAGRVSAAYCLSEADAGSDVAALRARAKRHGDHYVLSGSKYWITNAGIADTYTVFAKTDPSAGRRGISCFVVEAGWGVEVAKLEHKLGMRGSPTGEIVLDGVTVPASHLVGAEGQGFEIAMHTLARSRPIIGAQAVGIAQGALELAVAALGRPGPTAASPPPVPDGGQGAGDPPRLRPGRPDRRVLADTVAELATAVEAARSLVLRACHVADAGDPSGELTSLGAMAKAFAADVAVRTTTTVVDLVAAAGGAQRADAERLWRDAKVTQIYEGTNQVQRVVIAKAVLR